MELRDDGRSKPQKEPAAEHYKKQIATLDQVIAGLGIKVSDELVQLYRDSKLERKTASDERKAQSDSIETQLNEVISQIVEKNGFNIRQEMVAAIALSTTRKIANEIHRNKVESEGIDGPRTAAFKKEFAVFTDECIRIAAEANLSHEIYGVCATLLHHNGWGDYAIKVGGRDLSEVFAKSLLRQAAGNLRTPAETCVAYCCPSLNHLLES